MFLKRQDQAPTICDLLRCSSPALQPPQLGESFMPDGPLFEVAVIHHTQCGTGALADDGFRRKYAERIGADESSLREHAVLDPAATVAHDVALLRTSPAISPRVSVSGHVYDVVTGLVETVVS